MVDGEKIRLGVVLALGVLVPGLAKYTLSSAGLDQLGTVIWYSGYFTMVVVVWYFWLRPLDLQGSTG